MKILAIGDFHGEFPEKFKKIIKSEKIDLVVSNGDYPPFHYRKLWFKHCFGKGVSLWEVIGKKKYKRIIQKENAITLKCLKKINRLPVPVISVLGNIDDPEYNDYVDFKKYYKLWKSKPKRWFFADESFVTPIIKKLKNIKLFDYNFTKFGDYFFIGARGGTNPGQVRSKAYKKHRKILGKLFKKFAKENKEGRVIFVSHNVPYNTKLDKLSMKANKIVRGKHYGSKLIRRIINTYQPIIHIGGHIHEGRGKQKIGKTLAINPGAAHEGQCAIITLEENKKPKVKFIK